MVMADEEAAAQELNALLSRRQHHDWRISRRMTLSAQRWQACRKPPATLALKRPGMFRRWHTMRRPRRSWYPDGSRSGCSTGSGAGVSGPFSARNQRLDPVRRAVAYLARQYLAGELQHYLGRPLAALSTSALTPKVNDNAVLTPAPVFREGLSMTCKMSEWRSVSVPTFPVQEREIEPSMNEMQFHNLFEIPTGLNVISE